MATLVSPTSVTLSASIVGPQQPGTPITFIAVAQGGSGPYEYRFYLNDGSGSGFVLQGPYSTTNFFSWTPAAAGNYDLFVETRLAGTSVFRDAFGVVLFYRINRSCSEIYP